MITECQTLLKRVKKQKTHFLLSKSRRRWARWWHASRKVRSRNICIIQMQGPPKITLWWRICHKPLVWCLLWRSSRAALHRERLCYPLLDLLKPVIWEWSCLIGLTLNLISLTTLVSYSSGSPHKIFYSEYFSHGSWWGCLVLRDVVGVLEGHWPTHFVFVTYSPSLFRRSFFHTTWNHPFFPCTIRREDHVHRSWSGQCASQLQPVVRKELELYDACSGCYIFLGLMFSAWGPDCDHRLVVLLSSWPFIGGFHGSNDW